MTGLSNIRMKNEEAHIDTVRDDKDIENGDVDDDEDEDEDEVVEISSSSSSLDGAADATLRPSAEIHISDALLCTGIECACSSSPRTQYQPVEAHFPPRRTGIYCFRHRHQRTLSSLPIFASLVKSLCWTILVPLAVITELDGIATNNSSVGDTATAAVEYISSHMRSHSRSLKVQTSKGNYPQTFSIRSEQVEFA